MPSFTCSHGCTYSEFELEMGMRWATVNYLMEQDQLRYNFERDQQTEQQLAREHVLGDLDCPWPWYADPPSDVQEPEVFEFLNKA